MTTQLLPRQVLDVSGGGKSEVVTSTLDEDVVVVELLKLSVEELGKEDVAALSGFQPGMERVTTSGTPGGTSVGDSGCGSSRLRIPRHLLVACW